MASLPIPVGAAQVLIPLAHSGIARSAAITFGIDVSGSLGTGTEIADRIMTAFHTTILDKMDLEVTAGPVHVNLGTGAGASNPTQGTTTFTGGQVQSSLPSNCAVLVKKSTALGGRHNRGRLFVPWMVAEGSVDEGGIIAPSEVTTFQTACTAFLTSLNGTTTSAPMVLLHQSGSAAPTPVTALVVDRLIATQRRRLGR
jgi:hypothetical protein